MVAQNQLQYREVPGLGLYIAQTKALDAQGRPLVNITWYDAKLWTQERNLLLPTSRQWSESRAYLEQEHPDTERDMITGPAEWTDSLIAWPNANGNYASNLNPMPNPGKHPLLIQGSTVYRKDGGYVINGGKRVELPNLPKIFGRLDKNIPELGLVNQAYLWSSSNTDYEEGLRAVFRGYGWFPRERRFDAGANWWPSLSGSVLGFRPARRGLVEAEAERKLVQIEEHDYLTLIGAINSTEGTLEERPATAREVLSKYQ